MVIRMLGVLLLSAVSFQVSAATACKQLKGCDRKVCEIERQLSIAKKQNNPSQVAGLTRSLENTRANCTPQVLKDELNQKIADAKSDMAGYESDRKEAEAAGKTDKVRKYQKKIKEKQAEIKRHEKELAELG